MLLLLLLALASAQVSDKQCDELAFAIEEETTGKVMTQINMVASEVAKLVELTHDYIEPLQVVDIFPWENKMRGTSPWTPDSQNAVKQAVNDAYTELPGAASMRKILWENMLLQHPDRPLIWYALGLEPAAGGVAGGYFGLSQFNNDVVTPGQYIFDTSVYTDASDFGMTSSEPNSVPTSDNGFRWMRFDVDQSGNPLFNTALSDWGFYTPTIRPWYIDAKNSRATKFTEPYEMISTTSSGAVSSSQIGIGIVSPIMDQNNAFKGALDAEFMIDTFSDILANTREANDGGLLYIYSAVTRNIIATSSPNLTDTSGKLYAANDASHPDQMVVDSFPSISTAASMPVKVTVSSGGNDYFVYADEYNSNNDLGIPGMDWIVVTVWPKFKCISPELIQAESNLASAQTQLATAQSQLSTSQTAANTCQTSLATANAGVMAAQTQTANKQDDLDACNTKLDDCNAKECSKAPVIIVGIALILLALVFCIYVQRSKKMAVLDGGSEMTKP